MVLLKAQLKVYVWFAAGAVVARLPLDVFPISFDLPIMCAFMGAVALVFPVLLITLLLKVRKGQTLQKILPLSVVRSQSGRSLIAFSIALHRTFTFARWLRRVKSLTSVLIYRVGGRIFRWSRWRYCCQGYKSNAVSGLWSAGCWSHRFG